MFLFVFRFFPSSSIFILKTSAHRGKAAKINNQKTRYKYRLDFINDISSFVSQDCQLLSQKSREAKKQKLKSGKSKSQEVNCMYIVLIYYFNTVHILLYPLSYYSFIVILYKKLMCTIFFYSRRIKSLHI